MQDNYDTIKATGTELIAISSDNVNSAKSSVQREGITYPVLADNSLDVIKAYNVVSLANIRLARASSFIIRMDGSIAWVSLNQWDDRVPTSDILTELGKL